MDSGPTETATELVRGPFDRLARLATPTSVRFILLGAVVYAAVLLATFPARLALQWAGAGALAQQSSGTVWDGQADLGQGARVRWTMAPLRTLGELAIAADLAVDGPGTGLTARARWRPRRLELEDVAGPVGWPLVAALAPRLPMSCDLKIDAKIRRLVIAGPRSGAEGGLSTGIGACKGSNGATAILPALFATATMDGSGSRAWLGPLIGAPDRLAEATVAPDGAMKFVIHPAGAALLPAGALPGGLTLETRL